MQARILSLDNDVYNFGALSTCHVTFLLYRHNEDQGCESIVYQKASMICTKLICLIL